MLGAEMIDYFHDNLFHPEESRLTDTICQTLYIKDLDKKVKNYVKIAS